jgi:hypothetical protein
MNAELIAASEKRILSENCALSLFSSLLSLTTSRLERKRQND